MDQPVLRIIILTTFIACATFCSKAQASEEDPWFGHDKALHFSATAILSSAGYAASVPFADTATNRSLTGASVAMTAGIAKELFDLAGYGDPSWRDFTWDIAGTVVGTAVALAVDLLLVPMLSQ
jgi:putative lipoprotein